MMIVMLTIENCHLNASYLGEDLEHRGSIRNPLFPADDICITNVMQFTFYIEARAAEQSGTRTVGHSQTDKARSRQRILEAAASQLKENGIDGVSIADLMKSAKLTHGGFYGHFKSREDLVAQAVDKALRDGEAEAIRAGSINGPRTLKSFLTSYLNRTHRDNRRTGCAIAALAGDVARTDDRRTREIMSKHLLTAFDNVDKCAGDGKTDDFAITVMCAVVGAITLSRVMTNAGESDRVLSAVRKTLLECAEMRQSS